MAKTVQIDKDLFLDLIRYFNGLGADERLESAIKQGLNDKLDKMVQREYFSQMKTAATEEERQLARTKYLESR